MGACSSPASHLLLLPSPSAAAAASLTCRRCRSGFGIVRFPDADMATKAVDTMNNASIGGRVVSVRIDRFA